MHVKRIVPCLDVRNGLLTKGIRFEGNVDIGDPVAIAEQYCKQGADEIVFYDITASAEGRSTILDVARRVAKAITVPFTIGGGVSTIEGMKEVLDAGAQKVSINSAAVKNPQLIAEGAKAFGSQHIVVGMDVKHVGESEKLPSGYEIVIQGGRKFMGIDAVVWAQECEKLGACELCVNSIDGDGTRDGYDVNITRRIAEAVSIPIIASGGAGKPEHLLEALTTAKADAALVASIVHYNEYTIPELKRYLMEHGCAMSSLGL